MPCTLNIFEKILITLHASDTKLTRRELALLIYLAEHFTGERAIDVFDIYADGIESDKVNLAADALLSDELITSDFGRLRLTELGRVEAENIILSPSKKSARAFYRIIERLMVIDHRKRLDLAGYIWFKERGLEVRGLKRTKTLYESLLNEFSETPLKKDVIKVEATL